MTADGQQDELQRLREENARLKEILAQHEIPWEVPTPPEPDSRTPEPLYVSFSFTTEEKIAMFRRLFRGREDVFPQRWESA